VSFVRPEGGRYSEASHWTHVTFMTLEHHDYSSLAHWIGGGMMLLIMLSCGAFIMGTLPQYRYGHYTRSLRTRV
jgi:hypothetical protein